jgi:hypothetical protein
MPWRHIWSRDSIVGIATGYGLGDRGVGVQVLVGSKIFSSPRHPDWLWGPLSLLSNGYWGLFPQGYKKYRIKKSLGIIELWDCHFCDQLTWPSPSSWVHIHYQKRWQYLVLCNEKVHLATSCMFPFSVHLTVLRPHMCHVTLPVAWELSCQNTLMCRWCQPGQHSTYSHTAEPAQLLWVLRVKGVLYSITPDPCCALCVLSTPNNVPFYHHDK